MKGEQQKRDARGAVPFMIKKSPPFKTGFMIL